MQLIVDQYVTDAAADPIWQARTYDAGIPSAIVGGIKEMICDVTAAKEDEQLTGTILNGLEDVNIAWIPK